MGALERFLATFFNPEVAAETWREIALGTLVTLGLGGVIALCGIGLGLVLAVVRAVRFTPLSFLIVIYVDIMRAIPPLMLIILFFFAFPYIGLSMPAPVAVWLALSMVLAAYAEETIWAGLIALPRGQAEAARSTGLSWSGTMAHVLLPQALRFALPGLTSRIIVIMKNVALGSVVALGETLNIAQSASSHAGNPTPLTLAAIAYLVIFLPLLAFARWLERRIKGG